MCCAGKLNTTANTAPLVVVIVIVIVIVVIVVVVGVVTLFSHVLVSQVSDSSWSPASELSCLNWKWY